MICCMSILSSQPSLSHNGCFPVLLNTRVNKQLVVVYQGYVPPQMFPQTSFLRKCTEKIVLMYFVPNTILSTPVTQYLFGEKF